MAIYSGYKAGNNVAVSNNVSIALVSIRFYSEIVAVSTFATFAVFHAASSGSSAGTYTPEKENSRSPTKDGTYCTTESGTSVALIQGEIGLFSHASYISNPLKPPIAQASGDSVSNGSSGNGAGTIASNICVSEGNRVADRRCRTSRKGLFFRYGNELHQHQKTGSGAFSMLAPHFDNDVAWIDNFAWRNGMAQSDVWNMPLFNQRRRLNVT